MRLAIKGARVIDPASRTDAVLDLLIQDGKIESISKIESLGDTPFIDASGLVAAPGLVDAHCHLRDPGFEYKEDIFSGTRSAARGGFTAVACMPNTMPAADKAEIISYIIKKAEKSKAARVLPIGAVTRGQRGEFLTGFKELFEAGCVALSDDGRPVANAALMRQALIEAGRLGLPLIAHCEDLNLSGAGAVNEGFVADKLGVRGIPRSAEEVMTARELLLAAETGMPVHIAHVSTSRSVQMIRYAKAAGLNVTCETCPHYFSLTERDVLAFGANAKMSPPLRGEDDVRAVIEGLKDGTIDIIATDHAPHSQQEKSLELSKAPNGIVGFETAFSVGITYLVAEGHLTLMQLIEKMSLSPARLLAPSLGRLCQGAAADIVLFDPDGEYVVDANDFASKSRNSPYHGMRLKGKIKYTIIDGRLAVENGQLKI